MIRDIPFIGRTYRNLNRYREIIGVLLKFGFDDVVASLPLDKYIDLGRRFTFRKRPAGERAHGLTRWERVRLMLEELGPTFVKLGQIMSNRPDLLPAALITELEKLQDSVPPFPSDEARRLVEAELGMPVEKAFVSFDTEPVASASIAQVHRASIAGGEEVAVKVQRPNIREMIEVDLEIMGHLARLAEKHIQDLSFLQPVEVVNEFERTITRELDFTLEASNAERFRRNFEGDSTLVVPKVFRDLSAPRVLTMQYMRGTKISQITPEKHTELSGPILAERGANVLLKQIFEHGFFHADPHPGNIMALPGNVIGFLDFGMMGSLTEAMQTRLGAVLLGVANKDADKITRALLDLSGNPRVSNMEKLRLQVSEIVERNLYVSLKDIDLGILLNDLIDLLVTHQLRLPPDLYLLMSALVVMEGVGRRLDPDFAMIEHVRPYAARIIRRQMNPFRMARDLYQSIASLSGLLRDLPTEVQDILEQLKSGRVKIEIEHKGIDPLVEVHDQVSNRIVYAIVLASLIIGSSLIIHSGIPPRWHDIPLIGVIGYLVAALLGFWLIFSMLRNSKF